MKNFKRLVAAALAATMALALSVSAFAETTFTPGTENIATLTYDATNNAIGLPATVGEGEDIEDNRAFMSADGQITVVLATTADANSGSLDGTKIQYINQGVKNDDFWASMGIKDALALDTDYTLRIGTKDASGNWGVKELTFKLVEESKTKTVYVKWGDVNANGDANTGDATDIMNAFAGGTSSFNDGTYTFTWGSNVVIENETQKQYQSDIKWGDVNANGDANTGDATDIMNAFSGGTSSFMSSNGTTYNWNDADNLAKIILTEITE